MTGPAVTGPSTEAVRQQAERMLALIDQRKAECVVQQAANAHGGDDVYQTVGGRPETYAQALADMTAAEQRVRALLEHE